MTYPLHRACLLGLGCLLAPVPLVAMAADSVAQLQSQHRFDIQRQSLGKALIAFGLQAGVQVSADPDLLKGRTSQDVTGQYSVEVALSMLLAGSGLGWDFTDATLVLRPLVNGEQAAMMEIDNTVVLGNTETNSYQGTTVIGSQAIHAFPGANGDITTLLRMHPSVQFRGDQQSSNTPGELQPADISINGAKYYQNNFMIDGISVNNDLDPGTHSYGSTRQFDSTPSNSHGIALDADLLEEVRVYDSNVPAEYGGFNGGVIDAITRKPSYDLHGRVSASMTRSEWTRYHISESDQENFDNASNEQYQPKFEKLTLRGTLEGHLTENFGAILNFSRKTSTIDLKGYEDGYESQVGDNSRSQSRQLDNYLLKTYWTVNDRLKIDGSFTYAPQENKYFTANRKNSEFTNRDGGWQGSLNATWDGDHATFTHKLAVTNLSSSRESDAERYISWYYSDAKNWGDPSTSGGRSIEGGLGSLDQTQQGVVYNFKADWQPLQLLGTEHSFTTGTELSHQRATWERLNDVTAYTGFTRDYGTSCDDGDDLCSVSPLLNGRSRQWASSWSTYHAGKIDLTENKYAFYLQDKIQLGKLGLRPGLRFEGDDYMEKKTLAPRFAGDYDFFGDRSSVLVFGANRYYGRNLFKYRLADGRQAYNTLYRRSTYGGAVTETTALNTNKFSTLDIPYDDEWTLGLDQRMLGADWRLKYVHRTGKDKIVRASANTQDLDAADGYTTNYYTYTNRGWSESDNITLTVTPLQELRWRGTRTSLQLALDWSKTKDGYGNYDSILTANEYSDEDVIYDGKRMSWSELPASDFNRPWTARLTAVTEIDDLHLTISNFLRYRGKYKQIVDSGDTVTVDGEDLALYEVADVPAAPTWDMRVNWEIPTGADQAMWVAVDVTNVLDRVNPIVSTTGSTSYEVGRQYWLEVGYRF